MEWRKQKGEVVFTRARIGHTHMIHSGLLKEEDVPECVGCDCLFTVGHFHVDCFD